MPVKAVVFDLGETLIDETRWWADWAEWLGVDGLTLMAALGAVIARGGHHREIFELLRPGLDVDSAYAERLEAGYVDLAKHDLFPDTRPCLERLEDAGYACIVAGNADLAVESLVREVTGVETVLLPSKLGASKPDPRFFQAVAAALSLPAGEIAYVGDRVDNDVAPALGAGMAAVWLRRGPWARIQPSPEQAGIRPTATIDSLDELPGCLP